MCERGCTDEFSNEFLENSRYAKIASHVATTMETVNLNETSKDQALGHLVNPLHLTSNLLFCFFIVILD